MDWIKTMVTVENGNRIMEMEVKSTNILTEEIIRSIRKEMKGLPIFWSDQQVKHYSMDSKLYNGLWLENINYNNELDKATALIIN